MTIAQWNDILEAYQQGNQQPFKKAYQYFRNKLEPIFFNRYASVQADFDGIFNDKIMDVLLRTLNQTLQLKMPDMDAYIFRAIDNAYREILRKKKAASQKNAPTIVSLEHPDLVASPTIVEEAFEMEETGKFAQNESALQEKLLPDIILQMDEVGKAILEGYLAGKKDKQIKAELQYEASDAAFSDKKNRTFKKFRRLYALEKMKAVS